MTFSNVEELQGAADNEDTFVFEAGGSLSGGIDGGAGGADRLVVDGAFVDVHVLPTSEGSGSLSLDGVLVRYTGLEQPALLASGAPVAVSSPAALDNLTLAAVAQLAAAQWSSSPASADLENVPLDEIAFSIADLPGLVLGQTFGRAITIDATAAGWGWYVDGSLVYTGQMDLLSAVLHELGHVYGLDHDDAALAPAMDGTLSPSAGSSGALGGSSVEAPAVWDVRLDDIDNLLQLGIGLGLIGLTINGASEQRSIASVLGLTIHGGIGADLLEILSLPDTLDLPVLFNGNGGTDHIRGPPADTIWSFTGPGSGTVGGLVDFTSVESVEGAAGNEDTFVFEPGGSLPGLVDGGAGGYDTLVLAGGTFALTAFTVTGPQSGTIARDGDLLTYVGLEPTVDGGSGAKTFTSATAGADTITVTTLGTSLFVDIGVGEDLELTAPGSVTSLAVNGDAGNDTITIASLPAAFTGSLVIDGGDGDDTLAVADVSGAWHITGIDAGSYDPTTGPTTSFTAVENLVGAPTAADSFEFDKGAGISGTIDDGAGALSISLYGFVKISGDFDFVHEALASVTYAGSASGTTAASALKVGGTSGTGFIGVEPFGHAVGIGGNLELFGLAIITAGTRAWQVLEATLGNTAFIGLGDDFELTDHDWTVSVNAKASDGTYLVLSGAGAVTVLTGGDDVVLDFATDLVAATTTVTLTISDFVHISGVVTVGIASGSTVDVATGLNATSGAATPLASIATAADCTGVALARSADFSRLCNLPVSILTVTATGVNVFVGHVEPVTEDLNGNGVFNDGSDAAHPLLDETAAGVDYNRDGDALDSNLSEDLNGNGLFDEFDALEHAGQTGVLTEADLGLAGAIGLLVENLDIGLVLMSARASGNVALDALGLRFFALSAIADNVDLLGIPELDLSADNLAVRVNQGFTWPTNPLGAPAAVDFVSSFGVTGYSLPTGGDTVLIPFTGPVVGASADRVLLRVSDFVYVSGSFSFNKGPVREVDVRTNLNQAQATGVLGALMTTAGSATDPGTLGATPDGSMIWNLPVQTIEIGLSNVDVFVGYAEPVDEDLNGDGLFNIGGTNALLDEVADGVDYNRDGDALDTAVSEDLNANGLFEHAFNVLAHAADQTGELTKADLGLAGAIGLFLDEVSLGLLLASALPVSVGPVPVATLNAAMLKFTALRVDASLVELLGVPGLDLLADNLQVRVNQGSFVPGVWPVVPGLLPPPVIDFTQSFPDDSWDGVDAGDEPDGYRVQTNTANTNPVVLLFTQPVVGASADRVLLRVSDFVYVSGSFSFNKGPVREVDVRTNLNQAQATGVLGALMTTAGSATDPGTLGATPDGSMIWNLPVQTIEIGLSNVDVFVGYAEPVDEDLNGDGLFNIGGTNALLDEVADGVDYNRDGDALDTAVSEDLNANGLFEHAFNVLAHAADQTGELTKADLGLAGAIGLFLDEVSLGLLLASALPVSVGPVPVATLNAAMLKFTALRVDASLVELLGVPGLDLLADNLQVRVNQGSFVPGVWPVVPGLLPPPVIDFTQSFPDDSWDGVDAGDEPDGYRVQTNTANTNPVVLLFTQPVVGASADRVLLRVSDFVYVSGSFSFNKGPVREVDVRTNLNQAQATGVLGALMTTAGSATDPGTLGATPDGSMIWNLPVQTIEIGLSNVDVFVGYAEPVDEDLNGDGLFNIGGTNALLDEVADGVDYNRDGDALDTAVSEDLNANGLFEHAFNVLAHAADQTGELTKADLGLAGAIGLFLDEVSLGLLLASALPVSVGPVPVATLNAAMLKFTALRVDASLVELLGVPGLDLLADNLQVRVNQGSFVPGVWPVVPGLLPPPVIDFTQSFPDDSWDGVDAGDEPDGYRVQTNTANTNPVVLLFTQPVVGASADRVLLRVSDFVYVSGSFSFNKGPVREVDVRTNLNQAQATGVLGALMTTAGSATDPGTLGATPDGSMIWNLPVQTIEIGLSNVDVFVGYAEPVDEDLNGDGLFNIGGTNALLDEVADGVDYNRDGDALDTAVSEDLNANGLFEHAFNVLAHAADQTGELTKADLGLAGAIGLFLDEVSLGLLLASALPVSVGPVPVATLNAAMLKFTALRVDASLVELLGVPGLDLLADNLQVRVNQGSFVPGVWPVVPGLLPPPVIDFTQSFPDDSWDGVDAGDEPDGYRVQTNTANTNPVVLLFTQPVVGASADRVLLRVSDFVYVSGSFSFNKGPVREVDVRTNLNQAQATGVLGALMTTAGSATDPGTLGATPDGSMIWNLPVQTIEIGLSNVDVFVGYAEPVDEDLNGDGLFNIGGTNALLDEVADGVDYNRDGDALDTAVSEDLNANGLFEHAFNVLAHAADQTGELTKADLGLAGAIGLFLDEVSLGLLLASALPVSVGPVPVATLNAAMLKFTALRVDASLVELLGVPGLDLLADNLQVRVNQGSFVPGVWPVVPGLLPPPVIDFTQSFPDDSWDGVDAGDEPDGYRVQTNTANTNPVVLLFTQPVVGASADRVLLRVSDFVYVSGSFSFNKGPVREVDVRTNLNQAQATGVLGALMTTAGSATDPGTLGATPDGSMIWNLPVQTIEIGLSNVDVFVGYAEPVDEDLNGDGLFNIGGTNALLDEVADGVDYNRDGDALDTAVSEDLNANGLFEHAFNVLAHAADQTGELTKADLGLAGAIGLFLDEVSLGLLLASALPVSVGPVPVATLNAAMLKFTALRVDASLVELLGVPGLDLLADNLQVRVNQGSFVPGVWPVVPGLLPPPVIDFTQSFPDDSWDGVDAGDEPDGYRVQTNTANTNPVVLLFTQPVVGASADRVLLRVSDFVYVSGSFSFNKGPVREVDVRTNLNQAQATGVLGALMTTAGSATDPGTLGATPDGSMIWNLPVQTIEIGLSNVDVFVGYAEPVDEDLNGDGLFNIGGTNALLDEVADGVDYNRDGDALDTAVSEDLNANGLFEHAFNVLAHAADQTGELTKADLGLAGAIGLFLDEVSLGLLLASALPVSVGPVPVATLNAAMLKFTALRVDASLVELLGVPGLDLLADNLQVRVNQGSFVPGVWPVVPGLLPPPVIDFTQSFPDDSWDGVDAGDEPDGYRVQTNTANTNPVVLLFTQPVVGASADRVLLRVSDFVYVSGSFSFNKGPVREVDVRTNLNQAQATGVLGALMTTAGSATDPGTLGATPDGSMIWNLPVQTIEIGLSNVDVFVGYAEPVDEDLNGDGLFNIGGTNALLDEVADGVDYNRDGDALDTAVSEDLNANGLFEHAFNVLAHAADQTGELTKADLGLAGAIGLFLDEVSLGLLLASALPVSVGPVPVATLNAAMLKFTALRVDASLVELLGVPGLDLLADNLQVRVNQGSFVPGVWPVVPGLLPPPVIDFTQSFPDDSWDGVDAGDEPDGYRVQTNTANTNPVVLLFTQPVVGASADRVLLRVSDFVYVSGSFSFNKGPVREVDVRTNLNQAQATGVLGALMTTAGSATDPGTLGATPDGSMIWNLPVQTIEIGLSNVDVFVGYAEPVDEDLNGDGLFNIGGTNALLDEVADGVDYNRDGDALDTAVSEDLNANGLFEHAFNVLAHAADQTGELTKADLGLAGAIGLFLDEVSLGLLLASALPVSVGPVPVATLNAAMLKFTALRVDASLVELLGVPGLDLLADNLQVRVNQGSFVPGVWPVVPGLLPPPVIDFTQSFPDDSWDGVDAGDEPDGYRVQTNTANTNPVVLLFTQPVVGASADRVLLRVSDFVYVSGSFSFNKGPVNFVDVKTGLTQAQALALFPTLVASGTATDPGGTTLGATSDGSMIWNLPVQTIDIGLGDVDVFVGYTDPDSSVLAAAAANGELTKAELESAGAIGLFLDEVNVGLGLFSALPVSDGFVPIVGLNSALLKFFALRINALNLALLGVPELELSANNVEVRLNQGSAAVWPAVPNVQPPPVIDFKLSFPDDSAPGDPDDGTDPDGYLVATNTSGSFVRLLWDQPLVGASADNVTLRISEFVYVTGGFSFNKGPVQMVDVHSGLSPPDLVLNPLLFGALPRSDTDPANGSLAVSNNGSMLWNLPVQTVEIGLNGVDVFIGYAPGLATKTGDGDLTKAELETLDAIGFLLDELTLGMALFKALPVLEAPLLTAANLSFFALKAEADEMVLLGVPEIEFDIEGARVEVNQGSFLQGAWPGTPGVTPPPVIDFALSFPDHSYEPDDADDDPDGYRVQTSTSGEDLNGDGVFNNGQGGRPLLDEVADDVDYNGDGDKVDTAVSEDLNGNSKFEKGYVPLLFETPLIGGGAERVTIKISEFVYLTGSIYFEKGPVIDAPLIGGVLGDAQEVLEALGIPGAGDYIGTSSKQLQLLTIGALDVHAFVGLDGPYWVDTDGDGQIDRDVNGDIVLAETNPDAIGLVIDDLDFGLADRHAGDRARPDPVHRPQGQLQPDLAGRHRGPHRHDRGRRDRAQHLEPRDRRSPRAAGDRLLGAARRLLRRQDRSARHERRRHHDRPRHGLGADPGQGGVHRARHLRRRHCHGQHRLRARAEEDRHAQRRHHQGADDDDDRRGQRRGVRRPQRAVLERHQPRRRDAGRREVEHRGRDPHHRPRPRRVRRPRHPLWQRLRRCVAQDPLLRRGQHPGPHVHRNALRRPQPRRRLPQRQRGDDRLRRELLGRGPERQRRPRYRIGRGRRRRGLQRGRRQG